MNKNDIQIFLKLNKFKINEKINIINCKIIETITMSNKYLYKLCLFKIFILPLSGKTIKMLKVVIKNPNKEADIDKNVS